MLWCLIYCMSNLCVLWAGRSAVCEEDRGSVCLQGKGRPEWTGGDVVCGREERQRLCSQWHGWEHQLPGEQYWWFLLNRLAAVTSSDMSLCKYSTMDGNAVWSSRPAHTVVVMLDISWCTVLQTNSSDFDSNSTDYHFFVGCWRK